MPSAELMLRIQSLQAQRERLQEMIQKSLELEGKRFDDWYDDPDKPAAVEAWENQKRATLKAVEDFDRANAEYLTLIRMLRGDSE
jgi:hypothetical protein